MKSLSSEFDSTVCAPDTTTTKSNTGFETGKLAELSADFSDESATVRRGFLFYPSYAESYEAFKKSGDIELAHLFIESVIAYGTEGKEITNNPLICAVMASVKRTMDASEIKRKETLRRKAEREKRKMEKENTHSQ